jgi:hypothetical protein
VPPSRRGGGCRCGRSEQALADTVFGPAGPLWSQWPRWSATFVLVVVAGYVFVALAWIVGAPYAFAPPANPDSTFDQHWLADLPATVVQTATIVGGATLAVAVILMRMRLDGALRPVLLILGWASALFLSLVLPGPQSLDAIPVLNLLNLKRLSWVTVHLVLLAYTGLALAAATTAYARATRGACVSCGRSDRPGWNRDRWAKLGRIIALAASVVPLGYAVVRICWAFGVPVGTTEAFLDRLDAANPGNTTAYMELGLAAMAIGGGLLCFGLTRPWSQFWPRWVLGLAGRPVPHWFPIVMATLCGIGLSGYGTLLIPGLIRFATGQIVYYDRTDVPMIWVSQLPAVSLLLWGPLVLLSAAAFHFRTRRPCRRCGRGTA